MTEPSLSNQVTVEEITEVIAEFEQYRERLVNETLATAQKAKMSKNKVMTQLEPQLADIDAKLEFLRQQQATLISSTDK
jgi:chaperonin cofactor prefoldin